MRVGRLLAAMWCLTSAMETSWRWKMPAARAAEQRVPWNTCTEEGQERMLFGHWRSGACPTVKTGPPSHASPTAASPQACSMGTQRLLHPHPPPHNTHLREVLWFPSATAGDDGDGHGIRHRAHEFQVKALWWARWVGERVDGVEGWWWWGVLPVVCGARSAP